MDVLIHQRQTGELERKKFFEDVIVVAAQINDLGAFLLHLLEHRADEMRVLRRPASGTLQRPHVNDVAVEHQLFTFAVADQMRRLHGLGVCHAEVNIGHEQSLDAEFGFHESGNDCVFHSTPWGNAL